MKRSLLAALLCLLFSIPQLCAQTGAWGVKIGLNASGQHIVNVPVIPYVSTGLPVYANNSYVEFSRITFDALIFYDRALLSNLHLQAGLGYRQKGFLSNAVYQQANGYALYSSILPVDDNLFEYASSELSLQFRTNPKRLVGYLRLGQRLDYLLKFRSRFWGDSYGYFKQMDFNVFGAIGIEYSLNKKWLHRKSAGSDSPIYARPTALFLEIEGVPPLNNIQRPQMRDVPFVQVTDEVGQQIFTPPFRMQKIVRNTSIGLKVGVRF